MTTEGEQATLSDLQDTIVDHVSRWGYERREQPFELSSGSLSHDYIDGKRAVASNLRLHDVGRAVLALASDQGVEFDAVGGLTMGSDPIAIAVALAAMPEEKFWFSVRKDQKPHGKQLKIEGTTLHPGMRVLLVDDVVTTGRSILMALDAIQETGAEVVLAVALVDRGQMTTRDLRSRGIPYRPLLTYEHLGIEPVVDARITTP